MRYDFKSKIVMTSDDYDKPDRIEEVCNEWAKDGWEVFSVIVPQGANYHTYRLTARRPRTDDVPLQENFL